MSTNELAVCAYCSEEIKAHKYGKDAQGNIVCYSCCGDLDQAAMVRDGRIVLYLTGVAPKIRVGYSVNPAWSITNWPGSLKFKPIGNSVKISRHNWGIDRYDAWFVFSGFVWHGYSIGNNSELFHCKRTRERYPAPVKRHYVGMAGLHGYMPNCYVVGETRGQCADDLGQIHDLSGRKIKQMRRDNYLELDLYEYGNEYCEIVVCDCGKDISNHDNDMM